MEKTGTGEKVEWKRKYHMEQLLDDDFRLPRPKTMKEEQQDNFAAFKALAGVKVVKR